MRRAILAYCAALAVGVVTSGLRGGEQSMPSAEQVRQWVRDLGDGSFATREAASAALVRAGRAAVQPVAVAAAGGDPEVTRRAVAVLGELATASDADTAAVARRALT